jgi:hypothetical protein
MTLGRGICGSFDNISLYFTLGKALVKYLYIN